MRLSSKARKLAIIVTRPGILAWRTRHLFILSHMRSRSTVLAHVLGSNDAVCGYSELHRSYTRPLDTLRMKLGLFQELKCNLRGKYVLDKILHNKHRIEKDALGPRPPKVIILLRDADSTIRSIVAMGRATGVRMHADPVSAADYYRSRLACLADYARLFRNDLFFLESDDLVSNTDRVLDQLTRWLGLTKPLTPRYRLFANTGQPLHGDPSAHIRVGTVISTNPHPMIRIAPETLRPAEDAYKTLKNELLERANTRILDSRG